MESSHMESRTQKLWEVSFTASKNEQGITTNSIQLLTEKANVQIYVNNKFYKS